MGATHVTAKEKKYIRSLKLEGKTIREIAEITGRNATTICNLTKRMRYKKEKETEKPVKEEEKINWEKWAEYWKEKYLELHVQMVEAGHL
jgi:IS30 family transposase